MHYHIIGIAGNLTHNLALCLHLLGHKVTGSDSNFDEPMKSRLEKYDFCTDSGFDAMRISSDIDVVVLGMSMQLDNPELLKAQELGIKIVSFPELIYTLSAQKKRIVIGGSHGKTTTTSMIMRVLKYHHISFDWLVGSQVPGFEAMVGLSDDATHIIIEGDEYPDSKINLTPKFLQYHHTIGLINGIDRDHVNMFPTLDIYMQVFRDFARQTPADGLLYYNITDQKVVEIIKSVQGIAKQAYFPQSYMVSPEGITIALDEIDQEYPLEIFGEHNMINLAAAKAICMDQFGLTERQILTAIQTFPGSYIRMQCIYDTPHYKVYRDFAHSPSKLKAATLAIKQKYPSAHIIGVFELGTISANNLNFLPQFAGTFDSVDTAIVFQNPTKRTSVATQYIHGGFDGNITPDHIYTGFERKDIQFISEKTALVSYIQSKKSENTVVLLMSNSNFDGLDIGLLE